MALRPADFKSAASANFAIRAVKQLEICIVTLVLLYFNGIDLSLRLSSFSSTAYRILGEICDAPVLVYSPNWNCFRRILV